MVGAPGINSLSSAQQLERSVTAAFDTGLARKPSSTPAYLSRVLHIPIHGSSPEIDLLVHDVSAEYKHAIGHAPMGGSNIIGDALMGSRLFMTRLGTMKKPEPDIKGNEEQYTVDVEVQANEVTVTLQGNSDVTISLLGSADDFKLTTDKDIDVIASFPIPDTTSSFGTARHPFFTFQYDSKTLQWQIDPLESGPLRYTLVEIDEEELKEPGKIRAIYHHIGQGASLSMPSSEGVLLLPENETDEEGVVLGSLLGLLWRVRGMQVKPAVGGSPHEKKSFFQRVFKKD